MKTGNHTAYTAGFATSRLGGYFLSTPYYKWELNNNKTVLCPIFTLTNSIAGMKIYSYSGIVYRPVIYFKHAVP